MRKFLEEGHEVILGGDGESLTLLRKHFPKLRYAYLDPLNLRYSPGKRQVWAIFSSLPKIILWAIKDHLMLKSLLKEEHIDQIISDNRFGLYTPYTIHHTPETIYITHQLHIMLPKGWRWLEPMAERLHARIYTRYNKVWIPDYEETEKCLAGDLSRIPSSFHLSTSSFQYLGPLSRFENQSPITHHQSPIYDVVAVLSGLEPHRTLLEQEIIARYSTNPLTHSSSNPLNVLIVQGLLNRPNTRIKRGNITLVPYMNDADLATALLGAKHIIARSGYSTIMDFEALGLFNNQAPITYHQLELIPTPGQPEQEYLATWIEQKTLF